MIQKLFLWLERVYSAAVKYTKSSILSIIIIAIMYLLLTKMEQAAAMVVGLVEEDWVALVLSFLFVNALAFSLSHFPIYTYYAANLNESKDVLTWKSEPTFWKFKLSVFRLNASGKHYTFNLWANIFRYFNGFMVFMAWNYIMIFGYESNLTFEGYDVYCLELTVLLFSIFVYVLYGIIKDKKLSYQQSIIDLNSGKKPKFKEPEKKLSKLTARFTPSLLIVTLLILIPLIWVVSLSLGENTSAFSKFGLLLILLTNFFCLVFYFNFRLIRPELKEIYDDYYSNKKLSLVGGYLRLLKFFSKSVNYLGLLFGFYFISIVFILWSNLAVIYDWPIANGIPILFAYLYFYSFTIASIFKFYFVTQKKLADQYEGGFNLSKKYKQRRLGAGGLFLLIVLFIIGIFGETKTHELTLVSSIESEYVLTDRDLINTIGVKEDSTLFFIAAQGGGLKANFWTLKVLNHLQKISNGKFLQKTIAVSGASGGSLALGLYTCLHIADKNDYSIIDQKIDSISNHNFTSMDMTMLLGWDFLRKAWPASTHGGNHDRTFYSMVKYQNFINGTDSHNLSQDSYRSVWKEAYSINNYYPSLIMNTGATTGRRGVFWSHKTDKFDSIFHFAENLADLYDNKTISYYQAVSTTNRFPLLSPAAKIKEHGHYIDVGAIDNSGLLGCLDVYSFLKFNKALTGKKIVFVEIVNGKSIYVRHLLDKFKKTLKSDEYLRFEEDEKWTFLADMQTGLNFDKIPEYLSRYIKVLSDKDTTVEYIQVRLPHKVSIADIEKELGGEIIEGDGVRDKFIRFLTTENELIQAVTEGEKGFFEPWNYFEPPLSRHLARSNINFINDIMKISYIQDDFKKIETWINE